MKSKTLKKHTLIDGVTIKLIQDESGDLSIWAFALDGLPELSFRFGRCDPVAKAQFAKIIAHDNLKRKDNG